VGYGSLREVREELEVPKRKPPPTITILGRNCDRKEEEFSLHSPTTNQKNKLKASDLVSIYSMNNSSMFSVDIEYCLGRLIKTHEFDVKTRNRG